MSQTRQTSRAPIAKPLELFGVSHDGRAASDRESLVMRTPASCACFSPCRMKASNGIVVFWCGRTFGTRFARPAGSLLASLVR